LDISIDAEVFCLDEHCGTSTYVVLNPVTDRVTHLVVRETNLPHIERLVPVDMILASTPSRIRLRCTRAEMEKMEPFMETDFLRSDQVEYSLPYEYPYVLWPYVESNSGYYIETCESVPAGELAVRRGASVVATDGRVGEVSEFLVDPKNDRITHLVLKEGNMWNEQDITIPVSEIEGIEENAVCLKIDRWHVSNLPKVPIRRKWS
jgi:uncharacterized protein YrrD